VTTLARALRHPWLVTRARSGLAAQIYQVRCSHRTHRRAAACALIRDALELLGTGFAPRWSYDVRERGGPR